MRNFILSIKQIIKKVFCKRLSAQESEFDYLLKQGLKVGKNLRNHSEYAFDSLFPMYLV